MQFLDVSCVCLLLSLIRNAYDSVASSQRAGWIIGTPHQTLSQLIFKYKYILKKAGTFHRKKKKKSFRVADSPPPSALKGC